MGGDRLGARISRAARLQQQFLMRVIIGEQKGELCSPLFALPSLPLRENTGKTHSRLFSTGIGAVDIPPRGAYGISRGEFPPGAPAFWVSMLPAGDGARGVFAFLVDVQEHVRSGIRARRRESS